MDLGEWGMGGEEEAWCMMVLEIQGGGLGEPEQRPVGIGVCVWAIGVGDAGGSCR